jgi:hypothetical protein
VGTVVAATVMLTATACATSATAAAVVGDMSIAEQSIFDQTSQASGQFNQPLSVDQVAFLNRAYTTQDIRSALLAQMAEQRGVVVTDAQVNAAMAGARSPTGPRDPQRYRELLLLEALLSGQGAEPLTLTNVTITVDAARAATREQAEAARTAILAVPTDAPLPDLGAAQSLQVETFDLSTAPGPVIDGVLAAQRGDVLINQDLDGQFYVIRVIDRTEKPEQITGSSILGVQDLARQRQIGEVALLQAYTEQVGVTVNPRMGVWDPVTLQVVATPTAS